MGDATCRDAVLDIAMSIGASLDLGEMLGEAMDTFRSRLDLTGVIVYLFRGVQGGDRFLDMAHSTPADFYLSPPFPAVIARIHSMYNGDVIASLHEKQPLTVDFLDGTVYCIYHMPHIGILVLFSSRHLDHELMRDLIPVVRKLSRACAACLQKAEVEMVSRSIWLINRDLAESEKRMKSVVDELSRTRDEIEAQRTHLALLLQTLGDGIIVVDSNGNVLLMNVKALEYLDFIPASEGEITLASLFINCEGGSDRMMNLLETMGDEGDCDVMVNGPHSKERFLRIRKNMLHNLLSGLPEMILLVQDISRDKEIDRLKNQFISNLSHELRTPLNAIMGVSKVLSGRNTENLTGRQKEGLEIIYNSGTRLLGLINDILDLSKIEAGKMDIVPRQFRRDDMSGYINGLGRSLESPDVVFTMDIDASVPECIVSDPERIQQVVVNLVGNSFKFTEKGYVKVRMSAADGLLRFRVEDSGVGIPEKELPFIFERFRQVDGSTSRRFHGTGLGLALSRELVHLLGGGITLESRPGSGTVVEFTVPYVEGEACPPDSGPGSDIITSRGQDEAVKRVLLVAEDEEYGRETMRHILGEGYDLVFAGDGIEACDLFVSVSPDLVLMDIMMPVMDGMEGLKCIRRMPGGDTVPVIAVTARAMSGERDRIMEEGFDGYISKPVNDVELVELIEMKLRAGRRE